MTKLCHSTPVGSFNTLTKTVTSAESSSIVGRALGSWMANSFLNSLKRVNPQSHSSGMKRWCASGKNEGGQGAAVISTRYAKEEHAQVTRTANDEVCGVVYVRNDEGKLSASVPALWRVLGVSIIKIDGDSVVRRCCRVAKGEQQYSPVRVR